MCLGTLAFLRVDAGFLAIDAVVVRYLIVFSKVGVAIGVGSDREDGGMNGSGSSIAVFIGGNWLVRKGREQVPLGKGFGV